jgi:propanediol dehydratase large subunit
MAKKNVKKSAKSDDRRGRKVFEFVKAAKEMVEETIMGVVYNAIKKLKSGTVAEIAEAALKGGLKDYTGQDPIVQTSVMLNRLKGMGNVKKVQAEKAPKAKASAKGKVVLTLKKKKPVAA